MSAEGPRTRHGAEQAVQMARDRMQPHASAQLALDVWDERGCGFLRRGERRVLTKQSRIDGEQPPGLLIGGAAHHHAIDMRKMHAPIFNAADAAIEHNRRDADAQL